MFIKNNLQSMISLVTISLSIAFLAGGSGASISASLPLGDGNISSSPKKGYVFSCQQRFNPNAPGARANGAWLKKNTWDPAKKPTVDGNVRWKKASLKIANKRNRRTVTANNLPSHGTGFFPIKRSDDAYLYDRNPNRIRTQKIRLKLPANPKIAKKSSCVPMGMIGFSLTGAAIFNSLDARGDDAPAHEIQDKCGGHPERTGQYHYHNHSPCMADKSGRSGKHSDLMGFALDGFGIFGLYGKSGKKLRNSDLDACHGHTEKIVWNGNKQNIYHYHMTAEYPYTLGCFRGKPVSTGLARGKRLQRRGGDPLAIAAKQLGVSVNQLRKAVGAPPPNFRRASRMLGISEREIKQAMRRARRQ